MFENWFLNAAFDKYIFQISFSFYTFTDNYKISINFQS